MSPKASEKKPSKARLDAPEKRTVAKNPARLVYRHFFDDHADGVMIFDALTGEIVDVNTTLVKLLRSTRDEFLKLKIADILSMEDRFAYLKAVDELRAKKQLDHDFFPLVAKDGERINVSFSCRIFTANRREYVQCAIREITPERLASREARESELRYRTLADSGQALIWTSGTDKKCDYFNQPWLAFTGRSLAQEQGDGWLDGVHPDDLNRCISVYIDAFDRREPFSMVYRLRRHDGAYRWIQDDGKPRYDSAGRFLGYIGHCLDITVLKDAQEALAESREVFQDILGSIEDGYYETDLSGRLTFFNDSLCRISGRLRDELIGMHHTDYTDEKNAKIIFAAFHDVYLTGNPRKGCEYETLRKDGTRRHLDASISLRKDPTGTITGFRGIVRDITERVQAENILRKSEERYRSILENIEDGYYEADLAGNFTFFNDSLCRIWGYPREELMGMNNRHYMDPDTAAKLYAAHHTVYKTGKPGSQFDYPIIRKDGSVRFVQSSFSLLKDENQQPIGFRGTVRDITERKLADEALRESEERFRQAFSSTSDIILMLDRDLRITGITPSMEKILGYKPDEMTGRRIDELSLIAPASFEPLIANTLRVMEGQSVANAIYEFIARDGSTRIGEVTASPIHKNGDVIGLIAIARDVTERKQSEDSLRQNEYFLRKSQEVAHLGSYDFNVQTGTWMSSPNLDRIFGIDDAYAKNTEGWIEIIHPNDRDSMRRYLMDHVVLEKNAFDREYRIIRQNDGQTRWVYGMGELAFDETGDTIRMIGTIQDITERRQMQDTLAKSELRYRSIVENAQEGIFQVSPADRRMSLNPAFAKMLGYDSPQEAEKAITNVPQQLYVHSEEYLLIIEAIRRDGALSGYETEFYRKDKSRIWVNMSISAVHDEADGLLYYHGIVEDITPKKKMEQERIDNIERLRKSLGATIRAMAATVETRDPYTAGHQRRVADLARAIATEMGLSRDQIDGIRMAGIIHDIGKISIPSEILTKPTRLSELEFELIKTHSEAGYHILKDIEFPWPIARMVHEHHERIDGSGYPQGLKGDDILMESKILMVADVVEAISSHRPYRPAFGMAPALEEIEINSGIIYDADIVRACLKLFSENRYTLPQ